MRRTARYLVLAIGLLAASSAHAGDALIEGARQCTQYFPQQEREKNIPVHLLAAIASAESGRWHSGLGMPLPWPWTINVEGQGYYFSSKAEAVARTRALLQQGKKSIDVGCMQVNLKHHAGAFRSLDAAFDPQTNVEYAASFLRNNYDDLGDWIKATAAYHSRTSSLGRAYLARIEQTWNRIVSKVQAAQASQSGGYHVVQVQNPLKGASQMPAPYYAQINRSTQQHALASTHGVKVISVSSGAEENANAARPSVLLIAPKATARAAATNEPAIAVASASPLGGGDDVLVKGTPESVRGDIDNAAASEHTRPKAQFVFSN